MKYAGSFSSSFCLSGPIRDVQSTLLPSPSCLHHTLKLIPHFRMHFTSIVRWGPLRRSALRVVFRSSSITCCITFLNNTSVIRRKRCNSSTMTWFNGMSINGGCFTPSRFAADCDLERNARLDRCDCVSQFLIVLKCLWLAHVPSAFRINDQVTFMTDNDGRLRSQATPRFISQPWRKMFARLLLTRLHNIYTHSK